MNTKTRHFLIQSKAVLFGGLWAGISIGLSGCHATPAQVRHEPLPEPSLRTFGPKDYDLANVKLFIWPENPTRREVQTVLDVSKEIDDMEIETLELRRRKDDVARSVPADTLERWQDFGASIEYIDHSIERRKGVIEQELRKPEGSRNQRRIDLLQGQIDALEADRTATLAERDAFRESVRDRYGEDVVELEARADEIEDEIRRKSQVVDGGLAALKRTVEWFDRAGTFSFKFTGSKLDVAIYGWDLADGNGGRDFSTADGTIRGARYSPRGGVFEFDVHTAKDTVYQFRELARSKFDDVLGRVFFQGKIVRTRKLPRGEEQIRVGVAKLADKS